MQVTEGWSTEYNRKRWGVTLEETDWDLMLQGNGIPPGTPVPVGGKFKLMTLQAAVLSLEAMAEYVGSNPDAGDVSSVHAELGEKREELDKWLKALKQARP